jgi:alpha-mannosidase
METVMASPADTNTLDRLRAASDRYLNAFPNQTWKKLSGPGPDTLTQDGAGGFQGLTLEPGQDLELACTLKVPKAVDGVPLAGDELAATVFSLYPMELLVNGKPVFEEGGVPVAAGPCLFTVIPELKPGASYELKLTLKVPNNQTTTWFQMKFTTPGLRRRFEAFDVAWAQLAIAEAIAFTPDERYLIAEAAKLLPPKFPESEAALSRALTAMAEALEPLNKRAKATRVHCVGHSHIDMNWLWTWPDTVAVIKRDFRSVLDLMDEFPELTFSHSQAATYEVIRQEEPELFARVLERIKEGRWEPISMTWVEGDVNMASGEAHARQLLEGVSYTREVLGATPTTFHAPDTFGHAGNLPQLAVSAGARRYYHHRANPGGADQWPAYWWEGQDGTRLLAVSTPSYNGEIYARDLATAAIKAIKNGHPCALHFHGIGDHGGGPSRQNLQALRRFQQTPLLPSAECSTMAAYTRELLDSGVSLPVHSGESSTIFEGCYTTHADTKLYNRRGENLLCAAEALLVMAGMEEPEEIRDAWRKVLFNQFHDIFDGSAIHEVYEKNRTDFEEVEEVAQAAIDEALDEVTDVEGGGLMVVNPTGIERKDWVVVPELTGQGLVVLVNDLGTPIVGEYTNDGLGFAATVPALAAQRHRIAADVDVVAQARLVTHAFAPTDGRRADTPEAEAAAPYFRVETSTFVAYIRKDCGVIVSLLDKRANRELVAFGMRKPSDYMDTARPELGLNVFQITDERPHAMTAWEIHEVHQETSLISGATTRVLVDGALYSVLETTHRFRKSSIVERISFYADLPRIDFEADIEWNEVGNPTDGVPGLKVAFTANLPECEAWFETPFGAVRRNSNGQEVPALRWADVGGPKYGIAVLNDSKYGYDALGGRLRLTLLRSAYDPDAISDVGRHKVRFALLPHPGDWRDAGVPAAALAFNVPLLTRCVADTDEEDDPEHVRLRLFEAHLRKPQTAMISAVKPARSGDGQIVVRVYETAGRSVHDAELWIDGLESASVANILEEPIASVPIVNGPIMFSLRPWEVRTFLVSVSLPLADDDADDRWDDEDDDDL